MSDGRKLCCAHCVFNPLGCRCKYGDFNVAETYQDPEYPEFGDGEDHDDDSDEWEMLAADDGIPGYADMFPLEVDDFDEEYGLWSD